MPDNQESPSKELEQKGGDLSDKLLPCPFCNPGSVKLSNATPYAYPPFSVACRRCGIKIGGYTAKEEAIKAWNTRAPSEQLTTTQQALDSAVEALKEYAEADHIRVHYSTNDKPAYQLKVYTSTWVKAKAALASIKE